MAGSRVLKASLAAAVVSSLGLATLQPAAASADTVKRAKLADKARNAQKLRGIGVSRRPRPGMLLPLGPGGRFPASVLANLVDSSLLQRPLSSECPAGQSIRSISRMGVVRCQTAGDITSVGAGGGLSGGGASGAVELAIAPPLVFSLGAEVPLLDLTNTGTGGALEGESSSSFATAYFRALGANDGPALRADTSAGSKGDAVTALNFGSDGYGLRAELRNSGNPKPAIYARTAGGGPAIDAEMNGDTGGGDALYARSTSSDSDSYAGYFSGNVLVTGTLTKSSGSFRIDNPLDPANRYLQHSFVESPDMKNIYDGVVRTDGRGYATVRLPALVPGAQPDLPLSAHDDPLVRACDRLARGAAQQLRDPHRLATGQGLVAGDRRPPRRVRAGAPHQGRHRQGTCRPRALPLAAGARQARAASDQRPLIPSRGAVRMPSQWRRRSY